MMRNILFLIISAIFPLTGCSDSANQPGKELTNSISVSNNKEKNEDLTNEQKIISSQATYIGLIDTHSIEVLIDNEPLAIQINEEQMRKLEPLKTNVQINIKYYFNEETSQNILEKVEVDQ